jgi:hypothetical protein
MHRFIIDITCFLAILLTCAVCAVWLVSHPIA